jgi:hypothetical protein
VFNFLEVFIYLKRILWFAFEKYIRALTMVFLYFNKNLGNQNIFLFLYSNESHVNFFIISLDHLNIFLFIYLFHFLQRRQTHPRDHNKIVAFVGLAKSLYLHVMERHQSNGMMRGEDSGDRSSCWH